jgi:hypothetical protein
MNEKTILLFHDAGDEASFMLDERLTALLFSKDMAAKAQDILYTENEDGDNMFSKLKTMVEIAEELEKNGVVFEAVDFEFFDYNVAK